MRYVSLFTGIGGFDLALNRVGHSALAMVEKDKACQSVLRRRFPDVSLHDDVMTFGRKDVHGTVDIVAGGSPCQAFSVAGLRRSLADERGNLAFEFVRVCNELQPRYVIWENVPGVLSTKDNAFGCFLAGLVGEDTALVPAGGRWTNAGVVIGPERSAAWRVLDAQYFGVAQRRRRVFVVASSASASRSCVEILFEREGVRRDTAPRRPSRESVAGAIGARIARGHTELDGHGAYVVKMDNTKSNGWGVLDDGTTHSLGGSTGAVSIYQCASGGGDDFKPTSQALRSDAEKNYQIVYDARGNGEGDTAPNLTGDHANRITDYTPVVVEPRYYTRDNKTGGAPSDVASITNAHKAGDSAPVVIQQNAVDDPDVANGVDTKVRHDYDNQVGMAIVAFQLTGDRNNPSVSTYDNIMPTVSANPMSDRVSAVLTNATVRRLTPVECERLQAFPDGWTAERVAGAIKPTRKPLGDIESAGYSAMLESTGTVPQADTPRYKQLGNAVCVSVVEWIARRI